MRIIALFLSMYLILRIANILYRRLWNKGLTVKITFSRDDAFEGETLTLTEEISNKKALPLAWLAVKFQASKYLLFEENSGNVSDAYYKNDIFAMAAFAKATKRMPVVCAKRGYYRITSANIVSYNLLFTEKAVADTPLDARLTVYPKILDLSGIELSGGALTGDILARRFINPDVFTLKGIREYSPSDDFKTINTGASAKTGSLMVNVYGFTVSREIIIYLNLQSYSAWVDYTLFEKAISLSASLAMLYTNVGVNVRIISGSCDILDGTAIDTGFGSSRPHLFSILSALARLDVDMPEAPIIDFLPKPVYAPNGTCVHILISTYKDIALTERYKEIKAYGGGMYWIMPITPGMREDTEDYDIIKWEANHGGAKDTL